MAQERRQNQNKQEIKGNYNAQADNNSVANVTVYQFDANVISFDEKQLSAAYKELSSLPINTIPEPSYLPKRSRFSYNHNPLFTGRELDLQTIARILKGDSANQDEKKAVAIVGLGGVGKTQLATEFIHRYGRYFIGGVFWLNFSDGNIIQSEIASCGGAGFLELRPDFERLSLKERVQLVNASWISGLPFLLIFDNCEDVSLLSEWMPSYGACRILITSRRSYWEETMDIYSLQLKVLQRHESIDLIRKYISHVDIDDETLDAVCAELGDLPLAIHLAGRFLSKYHNVVSPKDYLKQIRNENILQHASLKGRSQKTPTSPTRHEENIERTFAISYKQLLTKDPVDLLAHKVLVRASYFAPGEAIPQKLLLDTLGITNDDTDTNLLFQDALARLYEIGLLEYDKDYSLRLHRLLSLFVQAAASDISVQRDVENSILKLLIDYNQIGSLPKLITLQPHIYEVIDKAKQRKDELAADLLLNFGAYLRSIADFQKSQLYYENGLEIQKQLFGENHKSMVMSLNEMGSLFQDQSKYLEANKYFERALKIGEQVLGPLHPESLRSLSCLAMILNRQGDIEAARPLYERVIQLREQVLGPNHPDIAYSLNGLGMLLKDQGDYENAYPLVQRALRIRKKALGQEHPLTCDCMNNLAMILQLSENHEKAKRLYKKVLLTRENVLGRSHPSTAKTLHDFALLCLKEKNYVLADELLMKALEIQKKVLATNHLDIASSLNTLSMLLSQKGDYVSARENCEEALVIRKRSLNSGHPDIATSLQTMGDIFILEGNAIEGLKYYEEAISALSTTHPTHPIVISIRKKLELVKKDDRPNKDIESKHT